jgi:archaellum biogenesis ATPase FlaH/DNA-binding MarR family transcriptional regulator
MYATTHSLQPLKIDQNQALDHLKALGYEQGDKIYVRYIHPVNKKSIKAAKLDFNSANHYQAQGYDVYFVVNGGGDTDSCVAQYRAIFYEHDNLDKLIQFKLWQTLGLPVPTIQVDTGGKSIHSYWVIINSVEVQLGKMLQTDLLDFSDGDRTLKNPSRVLRLAGSSYMKGDKPGTNRATIVSNSGIYYSYEQLRAAIPMQQTSASELQPIQRIAPKTQPSFSTTTYGRYEDISLPISEAVPIEVCLAKESRSLLQSGQANGSRNCSGAALARDLIGTANYLQSISQAFDGDEWQLFTDYCHRCPPGGGWNESEWQNIWKSAQSDNPLPSCKAEGVETCVKAWYWNNHVKQTRMGCDSASAPAGLRGPTSTLNSGNVVMMRSKTLTLEAAVDQARVVLQTKHTELTENIELEKVRQTCGMSSYDWERKIIKPLKKELDGDRFRLDLLNLLAIDDEVERIRQQAMLAPKYQMSTSTLDKALQLIQQRTTTPKTQWFDLDTFFDTEIEGLKWTITELLPVGETVILAGPPKSGKTLLAIDCAFAIATGESTFMKESVTQGRVLIVSVDESAHSTKAKLIKRGFRRSDASNVQVMTSFDVRQIKALEERLEVFRPTLVIIDSLKRITHSQQISENSAEFADNIYTIKELLTKYKASGILIHHTSKNQEAMGVDRIRGSSAISGAAWGTWQLDHIPKPDPNNKKKLVIDPKDPKRILSVFSRDAEGQQLRIELDLENHSWINQGGVGDSEEWLEERRTLKVRIIDALTRNAHIPGCSGREIIELMGLTPTEGRSVYSELNRMVSKRLISCHPAPGDKRYNVYSLTRESLSIDCQSPHTPPSPPECVSNADYLAETYIQQEFPIVSNIVSNYSAITQQPLVATPPADYLKADTASTLEIVSNSESEVGGGESERSAEQLQTAETLAARITKCESWSSALELIDDASIAIGKNRGTVLKKLIKCFSQRDRVRFLALLDLHASHNRSDERASKALEIAHKYTSPEVSILEEQT